MTIDTSDKPVGCAGSLVLINGNSTGSFGYIPFMPYISADTYKLSFKYKDNGSTASTKYSCLLAYDNLGKFITCPMVYLYEPSGSTITTLSQDLNNGDTIVHLTDVSKWVTRYTFHLIGIIESAAWKDSRSLCSRYIVKDSIDTTNNTVTLQAAWDGGTYKAGSKVREFTDSDTYMYPIRWSDNPSDWTYKELSFTNNEGFSLGRLPFSYFLGFGSLYAKGKFADLRLENLSRPQARIPMNLQNEFPVANIANYTESTSSVNQYGQLNTGMLSEGFLPVRYIRDWCGTNTDNNGSHWNEIQAYDRWERTIAFAADGSWTGTIYEFGTYSTNASRYGLNKTNTTTYKPMHVITSGDINGGYFEKWSEQGEAKDVIIDMGIIHYINKIIIWHSRGGDSNRIYHNTKTEVSVDGVNWITVFDSAIEGEYVETADGHTITFDKLGTLYHASMKKGGETLVQDIIED